MKAKREKSKISLPKKLRGKAKTPPRKRGERRRVNESVSTGKGQKTTRRRLIANIPERCGWS